MTPVNNQNSINNSTNPSISNNKKVAVKYINAAKIINNNNYDENYYPDNTLPSKTNNTLLIGSAILIGSGVSLLEMSSIAKYLRIFLSKLSFGQYLFRFINKIL